MFHVSQYSSRCHLHNVLYGRKKENNFSPTDQFIVFSILFFSPHFQPENGECLLFCDLNKKWQFYLLAFVQTDTMRSPETFRYIQSLIYTLSTNGSNAILKINSWQKIHYQWRKNLLQINHGILAPSLRCAVVRWNLMMHQMKNEIDDGSCFATRAKLPMGIFVCRLLFFLRGCRTLSVAERFFGAAN